MDSLAVSIYFTLYTSWNIYNLGQYLLKSVIMAWVQVWMSITQVVLKINFAFNVPKVRMILWSDCQSVKSKGPHGFGSLCQPRPPPPTPFTRHPPDAYKSPLKLVWPHGRKYYLERSTNWQAPRHPTSANEQAKWPQQRKSEKSRSKAEERREGVQNLLRLFVSPRPLSGA